MPELSRPARCVWYIEGRFSGDSENAPVNAPNAADSMGSAIAIALEQLDSNSAPFVPPRIKRYLLTCRHVVRQDGVGPLFQEILCWLPDTGFFRGEDRKLGNASAVGAVRARVCAPLTPGGIERVVSGEPIEANDWAILEVDDADFQSHEAVGVWAEVEDSGEYSIVGYPGGAGYGRTPHWKNGTVIRPTECKAFRQSNSSAPSGLCYFEGSEETRAGMSGGGVFDKAGAFVGVHRASTDARVLRRALSATNIKRWLAERSFRPALTPVDTLAASSASGRPLSWPQTIPPLADWPMADHAEARTAFEQLLQSAPPWRCLSLRGASETGKTQITLQMLANASHIPDLACGRFDFKGTTDVDDEVRSLVQLLEIPPPPPCARLNERLSQVLEALKRRARPSLLIFDTYEAAGEAQEWVEKQLLLRLIRDSWLRVVIAGQSAPKIVGAAWESIARPLLQLVPPQPTDWLAYGQRYRPQEKLTLDFVQRIHDLCNGKATVLDGCLGPITR